LRAVDAAPDRAVHAVEREQPPSRVAHRDTDPDVHLLGLCDAGLHDLVGFREGERHVDPPVDDMRSCTIRGITLVALGRKEVSMRDGIFIVDGDGHVMDFPHRCYQKYLPEEYRRRIAFFPSAYWDRRQAPNGDMGRDPDTPQEMMTDMELEGIDLAILYPTSALRIGEIREAAYPPPLCGAYNDFTGDWCKAQPDGLKAVAVVPCLDPAGAARELDRAVSRLGLVGAMLPTFIPGRNIADPFFWPIYEEA